MVTDVLPKLIIELRQDSGVEAIVGDRVRGFEPAPGDSTKPYQAFVVLVQLDAPRLGRIPVQRAVIVARCYGRTPQEAAALRWAVSDALHNQGPRSHANGLAIYLTQDTDGGEQESDPSTRQPYQTVTITAHATTQAVAP